MPDHDIVYHGHVILVASAGVFAGGLRVRVRINRWPNVVDAVGHNEAALVEDHGPPVGQIVSTTAIVDDGVLRDLFDAGLYHRRT